MATPAPVALPRASRGYLLALAGVALVAALIPLVYLSLVALVVWGVYLYAVHASSWLATVPFIGPVLYAAPLIAGVTLVAFTLKPFLARRPPPPAPFSLTREQEPGLAAFIDDVCRLVHAPRPSRIDVDLGANASAGLVGSPLRRGGLVVSFGLPLAATLDAQQFAAVLVHELAHCRQGVALRLQRVIAAVNTWLARVVYERDGWDEALSQGSGLASSPMAGPLLLAPALLCVAATRIVLRWLMLVGHATSVGLSRRMEVEADRLSALVVGSEAAAATLRLVQRLEYAVARANAELQSPQSSTTLRVPDDFVACVGVFFQTAGAEVWRHVEQHFAGRPTTAFDTHPAGPTRLELFRRMNAAGVLRSAGPARALFTDFGEVCRARTLHAYESVFNVPVQQVPVAEFTVGVLAAARSRTVTESFFGAGCNVALETLHASCDRGLADRQQAQASLDAALEDMDRLRAGARDAGLRYEAAFTQHGRLLAARQACEVDASFEAETLGLTREEIVGATTLADAIEGALTRNAEDRRLASADLGPFRQAATSAVSAALARLDAGSGGAAGDADPAARAEADVLVVALNAFASHRTRMPDAYAHLNAFGLFMSAVRPPDPEAGGRALSVLAEGAWNLMAPIVEAVRGLPLSGETVRDPWVADCHRAIVAVDPGVPQVFVLAPRLNAFHEACSSQLLRLLRLAATAGEPDAEPAVRGPASTGTSPLAAGMGSAQGKRVTPLTVVPGQTSFERALALRTPTLIATQVLVGLTILLFASWAHRGGAVSLAPETVLRAGAAFRPLVVAGEWWRLLAAPFLSDSLLLLAASVVALVVIGRTAERVFGTVAFLACFLVIGSGVALAGVLVSDTGLFVTLAPAVVGVGVAAWSVAVGLVASDRPSGTDGSTPALEFPEATVAGLFGTLALLVALTVFRAEDGILAQSLAVAMGLLLARAATADARFRKPAGRHVAAVALLAAAVLGIGLAYLSSKSDFRSEGFSLLATEERALDSFSKTLRRARWRGPAVAEELKPIVAQALRACASAQARADQMAARYQAEVVRNAKLDRYGRIANWREWVAARHQVDMGVAYKEYLRSREGVWQARLRFVSEGRLDTLKQMNVADAQARTALRQVLVRRESTGP